MAFRISPGVNISEFGGPTIVPAVGTTEGGFAGAFQWGPIDEIMTVEDELQLVDRVHTPDANSYISFFTAADFLSYGKTLRLVRAGAVGMKNATANGAAPLIKNTTDYEINFGTGANTYGAFAAKWPGGQGNGLKVSMYAGNSSVGFSSWPYNRNFDSAPTTSEYVAQRGGANDELHIVVIDGQGKFTGQANTVLERFGYVSKAADAKATDGTSNYYKNVINDKSKYVWWLAHPDAGLGFANSTNWGSQANTQFHGGDNFGYTVSLANGMIATPASANLITAFSLFTNGNDVDVSLIMTGDSGNTVINHVIQNIAEVRKDCVVFVSPEFNSVVNNAGSETTAIISDRNEYGSSSYAFMDCQWGYRYDKYSDVKRWVPVNGGTAGLAVRTDLTRDPWYSIAGFERGQYKNYEKLAWSPSETNADDLYRNGINPIYNFKGEGIVLFGDKTLLSRPSAFDRINVRRLFIILEKAIARAAKYSLFEFNDQFTRSQFVSMVEPFLRDVQGRRGIYDFRVVCDETNNTSAVIDRNEFVGDIYIKPARSINYMQLNFVAVGTGVAFEEIAGRF